MLLGADAGSPKFQDHPVIIPEAVVELSIKVVEAPTQTVVLVKVATSEAEGRTTEDASEQPAEVVTTTV